jgi:hypothetical protein
MKSGIEPDGIRVYVPMCDTERGAVVDVNLPIRRDRLGL